MKRIARAGTAYDAGGYATAATLWRRCTEHGNAAAENSLGYRHGMRCGVPPNYAEAVRLHRIAAEQGIARAQGSFGGPGRPFALSHIYGQIVPLALPGR